LTVKCIITCQSRQILIHPVCLLRATHTWWCVMNIWRWRWPWLLSGDDPCWNSSFWHEERDQYDPKNLNRDGDGALFHKMLRNPGTMLFSGICRYRRRRVNPRGLGEEHNMLNDTNFISNIFVYIFNFWSKTNLKKSVHLIHWNGVGTTKSKLWC
jgi:hypothetical protein